MHALIMGVAAMAVGIQCGWQRMPEGGMQYIIELEPEMLQSLGAGTPIESYIPPAAGEVRSYRIIVGSKQLPRETPPASKIDTPKTPYPGEPASATPPPLLADAKGKPIAGSRAVYEESEGAAAGKSQPKAAGKPQPKAAAENPVEEPVKPWLPLTCAMLGLFASFGANVFLGWVAWDFRQRYRAKCAAQ
jgi:hypothetical protein